MEPDATRDKDNSEQPGNHPYAAERTSGKVSGGGGLGQEGSACLETEESKNHVH